MSVEAQLIGCLPKAAEAILNAGAPLRARPRKMRSVAVMPLWLTIVLGVVAGLAIIAASLAIAFAPYLRARPPNSNWPSGEGGMKLQGYPASGGFSSSGGGGSCGGLGEPGC
jgi:uncharacterized membrane protein YgcG